MKTSRNPVVTTKTKIISTARGLRSALDTDLRDLVETARTKLLPDPNSTRVFHVAEYLVNSSNSRDTAEHPMTPRRLHELLYLSQAWNLALTGRPLFDAVVQAQPEGPTVAVLDEHLPRSRREYHDPRDTRPVTITTLRLARMRFHLAHTRRLAVHTLGTLAASRLTRKVHETR